MMVIIRVRGFILVIGKMNKRMKRLLKVLLQ